MWEGAHRSYVVPVDTWHHLAPMHHTPARPHSLSHTLTHTQALSHTHTHTHTHARTHAHTHTSTHARTRAHTNKHTHTVSHSCAPPCGCATFLTHTLPPCDCMLLPPAPHEVRTCPPPVPPSMHLTWTTPPCTSFFQSPGPPLPSGSPVTLRHLFQHGLAPLVLLPPDLPCYCHLTCHATAT